MQMEAWGPTTVFKLGSVKCRLYYYTHYNRILLNRNHYNRGTNNWSPYDENCNEIYNQYHNRAHNRSHNYCWHRILWEIRCSVVMFVRYGKTPHSGLRTVRTHRSLVLTLWLNPILDNQKHSHCVMFCSDRLTTEHRKCLCKQSICSWSTKGKSCPSDDEGNFPLKTSYLGSLRSIMREINIQNHGTIDLTFQLWT